MPPVVEVAQDRAATPAGDGAGTSVAGEGHELEFQCFAGHSQWILGLPLLQSLGFKFMFGARSDGSLVISPDNRAYPLQPGAAGLWYLRCHSPERGRIVVGGGP